MNKRPESSMMVSQADMIRREAFGAKLLDPRHGDIIFRFPETGSPGHEEKTLFASSDLLVRFSPWFKQCTDPRTRNSHLFLNSTPFFIPSLFHSLPTVVSFPTRSFVWHRVQSLY